MLSVLRVFSFSPATDCPAATATSPRVSLCFFREFQLYGRTKKGDTRVVGDWTAKLRNTAPTTTCRACRRANDFNSVPLSQHGRGSFRLLIVSFVSSSLVSSPHPYSAQLGLFHKTKLSSNPATSIAKYLNSQRERPPCFDVLVCFAGNGRMLKYRENWW